MSVLLLGTDHDNVVNFRNQRWWAEKGLICLENRITGAFETMTVRTCLQRLNALSEMIGNSRRRDKDNHPQEVKEHHDFFDAMILVCKRAQDQGRPDVAAHQAQMKRDRPNSRVMVTPSALSAF